MSLISAVPSISIIAFARVITGKAEYYSVIISGSKTSISK
jgi:hypothetical protein